MPAGGRVSAHPCCGRCLLLLLLLLLLRLLLLPCFLPLSPLLLLQVLLER
jgi:hypothetical protein